MEYLRPSLLWGAMFFWSISVYAEDVCEEWFAASAIEPGAECLGRCVALEIGMSTSGCPLGCANYCKETPLKKITFNLSQLYPSLTPAERALSAQYPRKTWGAYRLSWEAEDLCETVYKTSRSNDESDACRHFVWAGLILERYDLDFARMVLDAHEQNDAQPEAEKAMDMANNQRGLFVTKKQIEAKSFSRDNVIKAFQDELAKKSVVILVPRKGGGQ